MKPVTTPETITVTINPDGVSCTEIGEPEPPYADCAADPHIKEPGFEYKRRM